MSPPTSTEVTFNLDFQPLWGIVDLANASSREIDAYASAGIEENDMEALRKRFNLIVERIELWIKEGMDGAGFPIPSDWDITAHVIYPKFL